MFYFCKYYTLWEFINLKDYELRNLTVLSLEEGSFNLAALVYDNRFDKICLNLSKCVELEKLSLRGAEFSTYPKEYIQKFFKGLSNCHKISTLDLSLNETSYSIIDKSFFKELGKYLKSLKNFKSLNLNYYNFADLDLLNFFNKYVLTSIKNLNHLSLVGCGITKISQSSIADLFSHIKLTNLKSLDLSENLFNDLPKVGRLVSEIDRFTNLRHLKLCSNFLSKLVDMDPKIIEIIKQYALTNKTIKSIDFGQETSADFKELIQSQLYINLLNRKLSLSSDYFITIKQIGEILDSYSRNFNYVEVDTKNLIINCCDLPNEILLRICSYASNIDVLTGADNFNEMVNIPDSIFNSKYQEIIPLFTSKLKELGENKSHYKRCNDSPEDQKRMLFKKKKK